MKKRLISVLLGSILFVTSVPINGLAANVSANAVETALESASQSGEALDQLQIGSIDMNSISWISDSEELEEAGENTAIPTKPVHNCTKKDDGSDNTTWSYVYFGSYPQSEVADEGIKTAIETALSDNGMTDGDIWVGNKRYRKLKIASNHPSAYWKNKGYAYFEWKKIKWRVMQSENGSMMLMADQILDGRNYHDDYTDVTWENSDLRKWLGQQFYQEAFSPAEQAAILERELVNEDNRSFATEGGNNTKDKLFVISESEVQQESMGFCSDYSVHSASRKVRETAYASAVGAGQSVGSTGVILGDGAWWLRTPGDTTDCAAYVDENGYVFRRGNDVDSDIDGGLGGVVPALYIDAGSDQWSADSQLGNQPIQQEDSAELTKLKLESVTYSYGTQSINVLSSAHTIETTHGKFKLECKSVDSAEIDKYALYSGVKKLYENTSGIFEDVDASKFTSGSEVYIRTYHDTKCLTSKLLLEVKDKNPIIKSSLTLGGSSGIKMKLDDEVPIIGGSDFCFNLPEIPVSCVIEDGRIKVGINIKKSELYSSDSYNGVTTTTTKKKSISQKIEDWKKDLSKDGLKTQYINQDWKGYLERKDLGADIPGCKEKVSFEVFGYAEGTWSDSLEKISGEIVVAISASQTFQSQYVFLSIPITVNVNVSARGEIDAKAGYNFIDQNWYGDIGLNCSIALEPYVGVGVSTWISAGVYGQVKVGLKSTLLATKTSGKSPGLDEVYMYGEAGLKAYLAKKELGHLTLCSMKNLKNTKLGRYIDGSNNLLLYSRTKMSVLNNTSESLGIATLSNVMNTNLILDDATWNEQCKSEYLGRASMQDGIILKDVYSAAAPKMGTVGSQTVITYVDNDDTRPLANQTALYYIIYDEKSNTFSVPQMVMDDGTADCEPELVVQDNHIYLYYLNSTYTYSEFDNPSLEEYAKTFGIAVAEYDSVSKKFIHLGTLYEDVYCYHPVLLPDQQKLVVAWVENKENHVMGLNKKNDVKYAVYENGVWGDIHTIFENSNAVTSLALGKSGDKLSIAYGKDVDNDLTTTEQLFTLADENGIELYTMKDNITSIRYINLDDLGMVFACNKNGALAYYDWKSSDILNLTEENVMDVSSEFQMDKNRIYYLKNDTMSGSRNVYFLQYKDGHYGSSFITEESSYVDSFSCSNGKIVYLVTNTSMVEDDVSGTENLMTESNVKLLQAIERNDLILQNIEFDDSSLVPGQDQEFSLWVQNNGTGTVNGFDIAFGESADKTTMQRKRISETLLPGEVKEITATFKLPDNLENRHYQLEISDVNSTVEEMNPNDNGMSVEISKTELQVSTEYVLGNEANFLKINVDNLSYVSTDADLSVKNLEGNTIFSTKENIPANTCVEKIVTLPENIIPDGQADTILYVTVTADKEEYYLSNNVYDQRIWMVEKTEPELGVTEEIETPIEHSLEKTTEEDTEKETDKTIGEKPKKENTPAEEAKKESIPTEESENENTPTEESEKENIPAQEGENEALENTTKSSEKTPVEQVLDEKDGIYSSAQKGSQIDAYEKDESDNNKIVKVAAVTITGISQKIAAGKKMVLTSTVSPQDASNKKVNWSSSNSKYAVVSPTGMVSTKKAGAGKTVTITATATDGSGVKAVYTIKLMRDAISKLQIKHNGKLIKNGKTISAKAGKSISLKTDIKLKQGKGKVKKAFMANKSIKWVSSNTRFATVSKSGRVKLLKTGKGKTVTITAQALDGSNKKARIQIRIK